MNYRKIMFGLVSGVAMGAGELMVQALGNKLLSRQNERLNTILKEQEKLMNKLVQMYGMVPSTFDTDK